MSKIIAISGGSCSGKTTLAKKLLNFFGDDRAGLLAQDSFYFDQSDRFDFDGGSVNFDHPDAIDFSLLENVILRLKNGEAVEIPIYDFATHKRVENKDLFAPKDIVIIDGTLILSQENLLPLFDHSCFVECDKSTRLERRLKRDTEERGRSQAGVLEQFSEQVEPMHVAFVEPSKSNAEAVYSQEHIMSSGFVEQLASQWWC